MTLKLKKKKRYSKFSVWRLYIGGGEAGRMLRDVWSMVPRTARLEPSTSFPYVHTSIQPPLKLLVENKMLHLPLKPSLHTSTAHNFLNSMMIESTEGGFLPFLFSKRSAPFIDMRILSNQKDSYPPKKIKEVWKWPTDSVLYIYVYTAANKNN